MDYMIHFLKRLEREMPGEQFYMNSSGKIVLARSGRVLQMEWTPEEIDPEHPLEPIGTAEQIEDLLVETFRRAVALHV
jgi:hypothetical protein